MLFVGASAAWAQCRDGGTVFDGGGWVFSSLLGMTVSWNPDDRLKKGSHNLYAAPSAKSPVLTRLPAESALTLVGCDGRWAKVKYGRKTGWVAPEAQCTNTRTNCS
jgi:SH3-like domain-containing protein